MQDLRKMNRPHWSFSSLNQILNICSLQYFYQRVERLEAEFTPLPLSFGSAIHRTLEYINECRMEPGPLGLTEDDGRELFAGLWRRQIEQDGNINFDEKNSPASCEEQGRELVACYLGNIDPQETVLGVNETFAIHITDREGESLEKPLIGEIDCVVAKDGEPVLIDWKTAACRWPQSKADKSLQATAYSYAYSRLHSFGLVGFRFDVLVKNKTPVFQQLETRRDGDDVYRFVELVKQAERIVEHGLYYPSEHGFACKGCQFARQCGEWHRRAA
jgi:hypothetical protein